MTVPKPKRQFNLTKDDARHWTLRNKLNDIICRFALIQNGIWCTPDEELELNLAENEEILAWHKELEAEVHHGK